MKYSLRRAECFNEGKDSLDWGHLKKNQKNLGSTAASILNDCRTDKHALIYLCSLRGNKRIVSVWQIYNKVYEGHGPFAKIFSMRIFDDAFVVSSFPYHLMHRDQKSRWHLNIFALFLIHQWLRESQKATREESVGTCQSKVQEATVAPGVAFMCHAFPLSPALRLNTSMCCGHLVSEVSNG